MTICTNFSHLFVTELAPMSIIKQGKIYHFQLKVPSRFQSTFHSKTLKFTLKTTHIREAQKRAKLIKSLTDTFFNKELIRLRKERSMDRKALNEFIREYVRDGLEHFDELQAHGRKGNSDTVDEELYSFDFRIPDLKEALSTRMHVERMSRYVLDYYPDIEVGSEDHERLCYEALKAEICILEALQKRFLGRFNGTDEETILRTLGVGIDKERGDNDNHKVIISNNSISLAKLLEQYQQSKVDSKAWVPNTVRTYQARMNHHH